MTHFIHSVYHGFEIVRIYSGVNQKYKSGRTNITEAQLKDMRPKYTPKLYQNLRPSFWKIISQLEPSVVFNCDPV